MIKKIALIPIFFFIVIAINILLTRNMGPRYGNVEMPWVIVFLVVGLILYRAYILWDEASEIKDFTKNYKIKDPMYNLDLIDRDDKEWIEEIKKKKKANKSIHAYSKQGSKQARRKAKLMNVENCFSSFLNASEVSKL